MIVNSPTGAEHLAQVKTQNPFFMPALPARGFIWVLQFDLMELYQHPKVNGLGEVII
jgi:hypothetical protein